MSSLFINAGLAAGVALAAIPVILHLFMKQTPKHIIFPALRLIKERQKRSKKKLKIKNWLLLLARVALVALMALALARPRFNAKVQASGEVETAMALVFDTSLSMGYTEQDKTRLDEAKARADEILKRSHSGSKVFVIDTAEAGSPASLSPAAARRRIESLKVRAANRTLNQALGLAYNAVAGVPELPRHEVYVLSDLARSSWRSDQAIEGLDKAKDVPGGIQTYLINLASKDQNDVGIAGAEPSNGLASQEEPVPIRVRLRAVGKAARRVVEFYVDGEKRGQEIVEVPADGEADVPAFRPKFATVGLHRVEIKLAGEPDPLPFDDTSYMTFDVQPSLRVLVVSDDPDDAFFVAQALDPIALREVPAARPYQVDQLRTGELPPSGFPRPLGDYACVFLLNVGQLQPAQWSEINGYVKQGGGLVVGVGDRVAANVRHYNDNALSLLPGSLGAAQIHDDRFAFGRADLTNTLFSQNSRELLTALGQVPVFKSLAVGPTEDARVLLSYQDETPALLERVVQGGSAPGRALLWTTTMARDPSPSKTWNEFPIANWSFLYLMDRTIPYLAGTAGRKLVVEAGETVTLPLDPGQDFTDFNARSPDPKADPIRLNEPTAGGPLVIPALTMVASGRDPTGQWTVNASRPGGSAATLGFSVNPPTSETQLAPIEAKELDALFGKDHYVLADGPDELKRKREETIVGRELFPWLMLLILLLVTAENALANTFYREKRPAIA